MEFEQKTTQKDGEIDGPLSIDLHVSEKSSVPGGYQPEKARGKSSQRLRYEAEVAVLKRKLGDLEALRKNLKLSQRKICQLLLVDPSAWSRWTKAGDDAPPHIYRALQWYLALEEKYPALDVNFWLAAAGARDTKIEQEKIERDLMRQQVAAVKDDLIAQFQTEIAKVKEDAERKYRAVVRVGLLALGALLATLAFWTLS